MVLGIVVDDAIVIGESIFSQVKKDYRKKLADLGGAEKDIGYKASVATVIAGAKKVATPSTIGVLTTMAPLRLFYLSAVLPRHFLRPLRWW